LLLPLSSFPKGTSLLIISINFAVKAGANIEIVSIMTRGKMKKITFLHFSPVLLRTVPYSSKSQLTLLPKSGAKIKNDSFKTTSDQISLFIFYF
jgi:hypothetical protein